MHIDISQKIIDYIRRNKVSTTEVADCLGKSGVLPNILPINSGHFEVGKIQYVYAVKESNWSVHEILSKERPTDRIIFVDAIEVNERAVIGDIVSKFTLLYQENRAIVCNGKMRDAHILKKENYPIWCTGVSPVGCFNSKVDIEDLKDLIIEHRELYQDAIAVCDDTGVVVIPKEYINEEFYNKLEFIEQQEDIWYDCIDRRKWDTYRTICKKEYKGEISESE